MSKMPDTTKDAKIENVYIDPETGLPAVFGGAEAFEESAFEESAFETPGPDPLPLPDLELWVG